MPIELGIWRIEAKPKKIRFSVMDNEKKLEDILVQDISILDPNLLLIGQQIATRYGTFIDLLAIDPQGDLVVIELKKNRTPRDVISQILDYASWVDELTYKEIVDLFSIHNKNKHFSEAFSEAFGISPPEAINENHRLVVVSSELDNSTERILNYLTEKYFVPINAVFFRYFEDNQNEYLVRSWLIDPGQAEILSSKVSRKSKENWNGLDWYVSLGDSEVRRWTDCVRYGFISAGGASWYSRTLKSLPIGGRIFAYIPSLGYVGTGIVVSEAVMVTEFKIPIDGINKSILDVPLDATQMNRELDDEDKMEWVVRIEWEKTLPIEDAYREPGLFANQNSACKLRNQFTLEKLYAHFEITD